ncbi:hypothetical protein EK904_006905 [Melospiza melodia maxima]|nr:hypothetical protein EK904_006905 [Melospiza melodia maxima]
MILTAVCFPSSFTLKCGGFAWEAFTDVMQSCQPMESCTGLYEKRMLRQKKPGNFLVLFRSAKR